MAYGCIEPVVPVCPIPAIGENGYTAGYNRGFLHGKEVKAGAGLNNGQPSGPGQVRYDTYPTGTVPTVRVDIPFDAINRANAGRRLSSDEALNELKRAKDKLDLGLITQEAFERERARLAPYIE